MKGILYIDPTTGGGGATQRLYNHLSHVNGSSIRPTMVFLNRNPLIPRFRDLGIDVHIVTDTLYSEFSAGLWTDVCRRMNSRIERRAPFLWRVFRRAAQRQSVKYIERLIRRNHIDLLHLNGGALNDVCGLFAAHDTGVPCVVHLSSIWIGRQVRQHLKLTNAIATSFIANSRATRDLWIGRGLAAEKFRVIYNGMPEVSPGAAGVRAELGISSTRSPLVGCISRLSRFKGGHFFLLEAFAELRKTARDAMLVVIGDGADFERIRERVVQLGLTDCVVLAGFRADARRYLKLFDVMVLPSENDSCPNVLLEAMQAGTPIVATDVGGVPEIILHERTGLLVEYGNVGGCAAAIGRVLDDHVLRRRLIEAGQAEWRTRFSIERYATELETVYMQCLAGQKRSI